MSVTVLVTAAKVRWIVPLNQCQDSALIEQIRLLSNLLLLLFAIKGYFPTFVGMERITNYGMENNAGMSLCTAGSREVLINGQLYRIKKDMLCFSSPIISIYELSRSEDYDETTIYDSPEVFYQAIKLMFDMILSFRLRNNPCLLLDAVHVRFFVTAKGSIWRAYRTKRNANWCKASSTCLNRKPCWNLSICITRTASWNRNRWKRTKP